MGQLQVVHLDTNVLIRLYEGRADRLSKAAQRALDKRSPVVSPAAVFELEILYELGKRANPANRLIDTLAAEIGLSVCTLSFDAVIQEALSEGWTRDPFDRLIVANAKAAKADLITADQRILEHYPRAIW